MKSEVDEKNERIFYSETEPLFSRNSVHQIKSVVTQSTDILNDSL